MGLQIPCKKNTGWTWWSLGRHLRCLGASKFLAKNSTPCTWWFFGIHLGCLGAPLGVTNSLQKKVQGAPLGFWRSFGSYFFWTWPKIGSRWLKTGSRWPKTGPRWPKTPPRRPETGLRGPKTGPRRHKTGPKQAQDTSQTANNQQPMVLIPASIPR